MTQYLEWLVDKELDKGINGDYDFIDCLINIILKLKGLRPVHNADKLKQKIMKGI